MDEKDIEAYCQILRKRELEYILEAVSSLSWLSQQLIDNEDVANTDAVNIGYTISALTRHIQNLTNQVDDTLVDLRNVSRVSN